MARLRGALVLFIAIATVISVSAQNRTLRFVSPLRPPFTGAPGKPRFALDLVEEALRRNKITATTTILPSGQYGAALAGGTYDGTAVGWRDSAREGAFLFSEPYLENRLVLVARHGADVSAAALAALKGTRVAIIAGYAYGDDFEKSGPTFVRTNGESESLHMLLDSKVDFVLMDELVVKTMVEEYPDEVRTRLQIGTTPMLIRPVHLLIRRTLPGAAAIIDGFNRQIKTMIADRTYHKLLHVSWIYADVDGDGVPEFIPEFDEAGRSQPKPDGAYNLFTQDKLAAAVKSDSEHYFFGGAVYNGWSSVPDRYKVDHLGRTDQQHPTTQIFSFRW